MKKRKCFPVHPPSSIQHDVLLVGAVVHSDLGYTQQGFVGLNNNE